MNGKMAVSLVGVKGAYTYIYLQPNYFNRVKYLTYGLLENKMIYNKERNGELFYVPTDWTVFIVYDT